MPKRGGKRKGAGRPKGKYKTKVLSFRVRVDQVKAIQAIVKAYLDEQKRLEIEEK